MRALNPKRLTYFVEIARLCSFSKAAAILGIAQPALSRHVRSMELELGVQLFYRNGRGVLLTDAGQELLDRSIPILEQLQQLHSDIVAMGGEPSGKVVLGVPPTVCLFLATPLITRFRRQYPKVTLEIIEGLSGHINEWLVNGRLDIAVLYDAPRTRNLMADRLMEEDLFLVCPAGMPVGATEGISIKQLEGLPLIMPRQPHGLRLLLDAMASKHDVEINIDYEMDALPVIKDLVAKGNAYTVLPSTSVYDEVAAGQLVLRRFNQPALTRTLVLASSTQRSLSEAARLLVDQIKEEVSRLAADEKWSGAVRVS